MLKNSDVAILICSSDSRMDILERIFPSIANCWPDCPYTIYVGMNSLRQMPPGVNALIAPASTWRNETLEQVRGLSEKHLIVILDDFLFECHVNQGRVSMLVSEAVSRRLPYLRLLPLARSLLQRLVVGRKVHRDDIAPIGQSRPFYSGLQIAIWNRQHFIDMLMGEGSVWDFEHQVKPEAQHYAITKDPPIVYRHLVEKGKWLPFAAQRLIDAGLPADLGTRRRWGSSRYFKLLLDDLRFCLLGYSIH